MLSKWAFPLRGDLYHRSDSSNPVADYIECLDFYAKNHKRDPEENLTVLAKATAMVDTMNDKELSTILAMLLSSPGKGSGEDMEFFVHTISGTFRFQDKDGAKLRDLYQEYLGEVEFTNIVTATPEKTNNRLKRLADEIGFDYERVKDRIPLETRCTVLGENEKDVLSGDRVVGFLPQRNRDKDKLESW